MEGAQAKETHEAVGSNKSFGRYELLFQLASGGMARIYVGMLRGVGGFSKLVAIKRIHDYFQENDSINEMFVDEARIASRISHPNVVQVIELGMLEGTYFLAMEYVHGESLASVLRRGKVDRGIAMRILADAAAGLHAAHELKGPNGELLGVVHRDVSPQNVLIGYDGVVKVTDFGVARAKDNVHQTIAGALKGKYRYMAPEQIRQEEIDRRADIYALGILLYEATTRKPLFKDASYTSRLEQLEQVDFLPPSAVVNDYPAELEAIVLRALAMNPDDRYQTAQELSEDLERLIVASGQPVLTSQTSRFMHERFAEHIARWPETLSLARQARSVPLVDVGTVTSTPKPRSVDASSTTEGGTGETVALESTGGTSARPGHVSGNDALFGTGPGSQITGPWASQSQIAPPRRSWGLIVLLVAAMGIAALLGALLLRPDTPRFVAAAPETAPAYVSIVIAAQPETATIRVDGEPVENPFSVQRERSSGSLQVEVTAPEHTPRLLEVPLLTGGRWFIDLPPLPQVQKAIANSATDQASHGDRIAQLDADHPSTGEQQDVAASNNAASDRKPTKRRRHRRPRHRSRKPQQLDLPLAQPKPNEELFGNPFE